LALSLLTLGERQYRSQDFSGALDTYRRALELDPNSLITHYRLGYVYTQSGNLEQAQHHLTRALEIENNFAPALAGLGYVYRRIGEKMPLGVERDRILNKAESLLLEGLAISPKLVDDDDESWWGSLGGLYRRRNQIDEAIRAYQRAGEITPKSSYAFSNLALLYVQKKDKDAMLRAYQRVEQLAWGEVQADVDNYWAYADLLTARLALGKVKEAEDVLTSVLEIAPADSPYVLESLVDTLRRLQTALGEKETAHIQSFIERIDARVAAKNGEAQS
jgi:tetratricopeptide (TPR) repeat protein